MAATDVGTFELVLEQLDEPWACESAHDETVSYHSGPAKYLIEVPSCSTCTESLICGALHDAIVVKGGADHGNFCHHPLSEITFTQI
jgi:hypothetical protein